jgi:4a-hydroxytetrahydrobiopterin dehydratase
MRQESDNSLQKSFVFASFEDALFWMLRCSYDIVQLDHHPEWRNIYNRVDVLLTTHDAGNIVTEKDRALAQLLDARYSLRSSYFSNIVAES